MRSYPQRRCLKALEDAIPVAQFRKLQQLKALDLTRLTYSGGGGAALRSVLPLLTALETLHMDTYSV